MEPVGVEPTTSTMPLSRSSQLSYDPEGLQRYHFRIISRNRELIFLMCIGAHHGKGKNTSAIMHRTLPPPSRSMVGIGAGTSRM